jgi:hypothetical protein
VAQAIPSNTPELTSSNPETLASSYKVVLKAPPFNSNLYLIQKLPYLFEVSLILTNSLFY